MKRKRKNVVNISNELRGLRAVDKRAKEYKREEKKFKKKPNKRPQDWQRHKMRKSLQTSSFHVDDVFFLSGIYYLVNTGYGVVYVGESSDIMRRIAQHITEADKEFDKFTFEVYPNSTRQERREYEKAAIKKLKPVYNIEHNRTMHDVLKNNNAMPNKNKTT